MDKHHHALDTLGTPPPNLLNRFSVCSCPILPKSTDRKAQFGMHFSGVWGSQLAVNHSLLHFPIALSDIRYLEDMALTFGPACRSGPRTDMGLPTIALAPLKL